MWDKTKWLNLTKAFLKISITILALYFVAGKIELEALRANFAKTNVFYLFLALIFFALSKYVSALRLNHYFKSINLLLSTKFNLKLYLLGMFYNLFLPGGIGGDGYKIYLLKKKFNASGKQLFWAVLFDRLSGLAALGILTLVLLANFIKYPGLLTLIILLIIGGSLSYYFIAKKFFNAFQSVFWRTNLQGFLVQLLQVVSVIFILLAIGQKENYQAYILVFLLSSIVAVLPITIGGLGAREIVFLYGADLFLMNTQQSITLSLWFYVITVLVSFTGIFWVFKPGELAIKNNEATNPR